MMNLLEKLTTEDYIQLEDETGLKHEYHGGRRGYGHRGYGRRGYGWVVAMSGVTEEHDLVASAIRDYLRKCLREKGCRIYSSAIRVFVPNCHKFVYPDATIICGDSQRHDLPRGAYALTNPSAIVEVSSKGTVKYDQEEKYDCYRTLASFREYMLAAQDQVRVEMRKKNAEGAWQTEVFDQLDQTVEVLGCTIRLSQIYEDINITD